MKLFKRKKNKKEKESTVKLIVTGCCKPEKLRELEKNCKKKGVKVVATSEPILGVFDL